MPQPGVSNLMGYDEDDESSNGSGYDLGTNYDSSGDSSDDLDEDTTSHVDEINQEVSLSPAWTYPFTNSSDESNDTNFDLVGNFYAETEDEEDDDDEDDDEEEDDDDDNDSQSSRRYLQMSTWS